MRIPSPPGVTADPRLVGSAGASRPGTQHNGFLGRLDSKAAIGALIHVIHHDGAGLLGQAAVYNKEQVIGLMAFVVFLRFIQNQLPGRTGSAAAFQSHPYGGIQSMIGQIIPHRLSRARGHFQHG